MERPILFSAPMVRAIIEGRKTQTRRLVTSNVGKMLAQSIAAPGELEGLAGSIWVNPGGWVRWYAAPGDRLWVRESLKRGFMPNLLTGEPTNAEVALYAADDEPVLLNPGEFDAAWQWERSSLPSIHMPRWASRLTLDVLSVRVERLQDISEEDAKAEGIEPVPGEAAWRDYVLGAGAWCNSARASFSTLWDSINGERDGASWAANPWVWCVSFKRVAP